MTNAERRALLGRAWEAVPEGYRAPFVAMTVTEGGLPMVIGNGRPESMFRVARAIIDLAEDMYLNGRVELSSSVKVDGVDYKLDGAAKS